MRTRTRGAAALYGFGLGLLTLAACAPAVQAQGRAERGMLGIRLWNSYSTVLAKHGPPTSVETGLAMPGTTGAPAQAAGTAGGMVPGMMPGMPGSAGMMGQGMPPSAAMGGYAAAARSMGLNRMAGRMGGPMAGAPMSGMPMGVGGKMGGAMAGGAADLPGAPMGMNGMPGGLAAGEGIASSPSEEVAATWVYQHGSVVDTYAFNKDGRVIQIASFNPLAAQGHVGGGGVTARGVRLGDPAAKVYRDYGWAKIDATGGAPLLDYTRKDHVAFYMADSKRGPVVTGIAITLLDNLPGAVQPAGPETLANGGMPGMGMPMMGGAAMGAPRMGGPMGMMGGPRMGGPARSGSPMAAGAMGVGGKMGGAAVGK